MNETAIVTFRACQADDAETLIAIRIAAMRPSLESVGRFDPQRARERFLSGFEPACTEFIEQAGQITGFLVVKREAAALKLDHLYVLPEFQGRGLGAAALQRVFAQADATRLPIRVGALRGSPANAFYRHHGFIQCAEEEWDIHYLRSPGTP